MRTDNKNNTQSHMASGALLFDPVFFGEDTGERQEYANMQRFNSRPKKESRPMYIGPDGKLHHRYEGGNTYDPHQNRMNAIFTNVIQTARS